MKIKMMNQKMDLIVMNQKVNKHKNKIQKVMNQKVNKHNKQNQNRISIYQMI